MAIYRTVQMSFWTDTKVDEDFTPEDKYFYLYLFTNPHTNLCGCYELGLKQAARETGYNEDTVSRLIDRFENVHKVLAYSKETREILLLNWHKYNWTKSGEFMKGLDKHIEKVKNADFKAYLSDLINGTERVYRGSIDPVQTSVTVTVNNNIKEDIVNNFNIIYSSYPKKVGKARGFDLYKGWLKGRDISGRKVKLDNKQIWNAIARYKHQIEQNGTELQYVKNFDTFMNKAILDYVEDDEA